jgi:hypothetical protein
MFSIVGLVNANECDDWFQNLNKENLSDLSGKLRKSIGDKSCQLAK